MVTKFNGYNLQKSERHIRITKSTVDAAVPGATRYVLWDTSISGFGLQVAPSGLKTFVLRYRSRHKFALKRFILLGRFGPVTAEQARRRATEILGQVATGKDPAFERQQANQAALTFGDACDRFLRQHVTAKRKPGTHGLYNHIIEKKLKPQLGIRNILKVSRQDVAQLHYSMKATPVIANRAIAVLATMYSWCGRVGLIDETVNPAKGIEKFRETSKERYLSRLEMGRLGRALVEAETIGFEYAFDPTKPNSKHGAKPGERRVVQAPQAVAAIRLLILTGCRVGEILNLRWAEVDFDRGMLHLPDSKSGKKTVLIGRPALEVIQTLSRDGEFVISGTDPERRRVDLKRPWEAIKRRAGLHDVRLHDLRHTFASVGAGAGLGLHIVGKLLGHSQSRTTARYAHLADDPLKRAAEMVSNQIADVLNGGKGMAILIPNGENVDDKA